jgi:16S rRNA (cytosine1402-N4)-methyltransferase
MSYTHITVLRTQAVELLAIRPAGLYVDATFGGGGHTQEILERDPTCRVLAFDWDAQALELRGQELAAHYGERLTLVWSNFARLELQLKKRGITQVDGIIADFGTSQHQIAHADGFSFSRDTPLDMRMSPAHFQVTAADILKQSTVEELTYIFGTYGNVHQARRLAQAIVEARSTKRLRTTGALVELIQRTLKSDPGSTIHIATKPFQALRIAVNKEYEQIHALLVQARRIVRPGGRCVAISFHSGEDSLVKREFVDNPAVWKVINTKVITPDVDEQQANRSARSAKLRAAERVI